MSSTVISSSANGLSSVIGSFGSWTRGLMKAWNASSFRNAQNSFDFASSSVGGFSIATESPLTSRLTVSASESGICPTRRKKSTSMGRMAATLPDTGSVISMPCSRALRHSFASVAVIAALYAQAGGIASTPMVARSLGFQM